ncbi:hypothetical protein YIM73052_19750 [Thermus antranikianii]
MFASLLFLAAVRAKPLVPMEGYPGEAKLLIFQGRGEVEVPEGFALLLPPEEVNGVVSLVVQVPNLPPGEYPFRVGESWYSFRILPMARAYLAPPPPVELGAGEETWVEVGVQNLGNIPLALEAQVVPVGVEVLRREGTGTLAPGARGHIRFLLRGQGRSGQVQVSLAGARVEFPVVVKPTPPPAFWDWARAQSRLVWTWPGSLYLEGRATLPGPGGSELGRAVYRLSPESASLDLTRGPFGVGLALTRSTASLGLRYMPGPYGLTFWASTLGQVRVGTSYAERGLRLSVEAGLLPSLDLQASAGLTGTLEGLGYGIQASYQGGVGRLDASLGQGALRTSGFWDTRGSFGLQGVASLGVSWNAGLGFRWDGETWITGVVGIPVLGTVEVRGEYGLASRQYQVSLFHTHQTPEERFLQQATWGAERLTYGLSYRIRLEGTWLGGDLRLVRGRGFTGEVGVALEAFPWTLQARVGLGSDLRPNRFSTAASLAFDLPLYPAPWPTLTLRLQDPEGRPLETSLAVGPYLYRSGRDGTLALRLPPGRHVLTVLEGLAILGEGGLSRQKVVEAREGFLTLTLVPARLFTLDLRYCPPPVEEPGQVYGLPGLSPAEALARAQVRVQAQGRGYLVFPGRSTLLPAGRLALALVGPLAGAYRLSEPGGAPLAEVHLDRDQVLTACLTPSPRPVEMQDLPPVEKEGP